MPAIPIDVVFPECVYHGTLDIYLPNFKERLLDSRYWKPRRDFGRALYTTVSIDQAKIWARSMRDKLLEGNPCVLEIQILPERPESPNDCRIFTGISLEWAKYIYEHRTASAFGPDPCAKHDDIVIGPMADADTGKIVENGVKSKKDPVWFMDQITRNHSSRKLDTMELGNQIAFCDERLAPILRLAGYHSFQGRRWRRHGNPQET